MGATSTVGTPGVVLLTNEDIDRLPAVRLPHVGSGVSQRVLWEHAGSTGGLMRIAHDGWIDEHVHEAAFHDVWVVEGMCEILGQHLGPMSYAHVPPGVRHGIRAGAAGCTLLYLYRRL